MFLRTRAGEPRLPRFDVLVMTVTAVVGVALVLADIFQRWVWSRRIEMLNIDGMHNVETWFQSMVIGGAALSALVLAFTYFDGRHRLQWLVVSAGLAFFSLDKSVSLHERFGIRIAHGLGLTEQSSRVVWQVAWSPFIVVTAAAVILCIWEAPLTTKLWAVAGLALAGTKLVMEALTFPLIYFNVTTENGWLYGVETNIEETTQLLGFAAFFAAFAQLLLDRLFAIARGEVDEIEPGAERASAAAPLAAAVRAQPGTASRG